MALSSFEDQWWWLTPNTNLICSLCQTISNIFCKETMPIKFCKYALRTHCTLQHVMQMFFTWSRFVILFERISNAYFCKAQRLFYREQSSDLMTSDPIKSLKIRSDQGCLIYSKRQFRNTYLTEWHLYLPSVSCHLSSQGPPLSVLTSFTSHYRKYQPKCISLTDFWLSRWQEWFVDKVVWMICIY